MEKIREALQLVLGSDVFTPRDEEAPDVDPPVERPPMLSREGRGRAATPRPRTEGDPANAEYSYVIDELASWGRFEAPTPDPHFRVLAGSAWRRPTLNPEATTYDLQLKVGEAQDALVGNGVLDEENMSFARDHVFDNWSVASRIVSGKAQYSGGRHWQPISDSE